MDRIHPSVYERADEGLLRLLEKANIAALTEEEIDYYETSMKRLEDEMDMEEHGFEIGLEKGKAEERSITISILKDLGLSDEEIQSRLSAYDEKSK